MISHWRYDEGGSFFEQDIRPAWYGVCHEAYGSELEAWFKNQEANEEADYELIFRFNSGRPAYFITIYKEELATAFVLRWLQ